MTRARRSMVGLFLAILAGTAALVASVGGAPSTLALFSDNSTVTTGPLASGTVTKPAAVGCTVNNPLFGTKSLTTTWTASSSPTALSYTAVLRETGQSLTVSSSGTSRSVTVTGNLLGSLFGETFHIDVTATLPGTSWTATSSRVGTFVLLGLGFACGSWT